MFCFFTKRLSFSYILLNTFYPILQRFFTPPLHLDNLKRTMASFKMTASCCGKCISKVILVIAIFKPLKLSEVRHIDEGNIS